MPTRHKSLEELRNDTGQMIANLRHTEWELVLEFFFVFSRFERALIMNHYHPREDGDASPDWTRFAKDHNQAFINIKSGNSELDRALNYYRATPPKKQVIISGRLDWSPSLPPHGAELDELLILVRRVRNNLFHGEKLGNLVGGSDFGRDEQLLQHGLTILYACLTLDPKVTDSFFS